jgi:phosphoglycolate phosphatase
MLDYEYVLFDVDGTLTDPAVGVTDSVMYALKKFGIEVADRRELYKFIGPPLWESFERFYGFSKEQSNQAVKYYREYYSRQGIYECSLYPGIEDLLKLLKANRKTLLVATSKPEGMAKLILEHFDIAQYFTFIAGATLEETRVKKGDIIFYALETTNILEKSKVIMIGDREHDIIGAKNNGVHSMGVLYGYGDRKELENAGADYIAGLVVDIGRTLLAK